MVRRTHLILILACILVSCKKEKSPLDKFKLVTEKDKVHELVGKKFPSKVLASLSGKDVSLSDFEGKPTMINLWFVACAPCIDEMPVLNGIKAKYEKDVNFLSITFDKKERVNKLLEKHDFDFFHIVEAKDFLAEIGVQGYPKNIFLNKEGIIERIEGGIPYTPIDGKLVRGDGKEFYDYIEELLAL
ncbi:TlpA family protein disulfide reductase [Roseivirga sp.]|uniref:TlpA family protein disulfide reductase n=1 Tax=Roseivirga sp. TaxID=1964215 RepID=UPI003B8ADA16